MLVALLQSLILNIKMRLQTLCTDQYHLQPFYGTSPRLIRKIKVVGIVLGLGGVPDTRGEDPCCFIT